MTFDVVVDISLRTGISDPEGATIERSCGALGFDGIWVIHPEQIAIANEIFGPRQEDYDHAENILDAYAWCTSPDGGYRGAAILGGEVIDAGTRKMALVIAAKGRAAGLTRTRQWSAPTGTD